MPDISSVLEVNVAFVYQIWKCFPAATLYVIGLIAFCVLARVCFCRRPWARESLLRRAFSGQHVWITGASQGLGFAIAERAARYGARVTISARNQKRLLDAATRIGQNVRAVHADVTQLDDLARAHEEAERGYGPVDVAIANAGINHEGKSFSQISDPEVMAVVMTNLVGTVRTFQLVLPSMFRRKCGVLCAVSSLAGYRGVPGASVYGGTKAAISALCQSLGIELYGSNIEVCCVHPGFIETPAVADLQHPKPFMLHQSEAAKLVLLSVARQQRHAGFPWPMEIFAMKISAVMPTPLYEWILHRSYVATSQKTK